MSDPTASTASNMDSENARSVVFRCDARKETGAGHVVRVCALIDCAQERGWSTEVIGSIENEFALGLLDERLVKIHGPASDGEIARQAHELGADVLHVDSYGEFRGLADSSRSAGLILSSMEDGEWGRRTARLVIDASPGAERLHRPGDGSSRTLLGAEVIPLRQAVRNAQPWHARSTESFDVLIILGGTDANNLTPLVVDMWSRTGLPGTVHVVSREPVSVATTQDQRIQQYQPSESIVELFSTMDLVISGAGTTIWELAALGVPMGLVQVVDNQRANFEFAVANGFALGLDLEEPDRMATKLRTLMGDSSRLSAMSQSGRDVVDGSGVERIVDAWEEAVRQARHPDQLAARPATMNDAGLLFDWRDDPSVRQASRQTQPLQWDSHLQWLESALASTDRLLLIVERDADPIGTVRFDREQKPGSSWEVSITVAPSARGQRLALPVLQCAQAYALDGALAGAERLSAEAQEENPASWRVFSADGYERVEQPGPGWVRLEKSVRSD